MFTLHAMYTLYTMRTTVYTANTCMIPTTHAKVLQYPRQPSFLHLQKVQACYTCDNQNEVAHFLDIDHSDTIIHWDRYQAGCANNHGSKISSVHNVNAKTAIVCKYNSALETY